VFLVFYATGLRNADDPDGNGNLKESFSVLIGGDQRTPAFVVRRLASSGLNKSTSKSHAVCSDADCQCFNRRQWFQYIERDDDRDCGRGECNAATDYRV
jgi:hypothetical protein